ncbi:MAG: hypothetical protein ABI134_28420 [Byssovorax sp.]
MRIALSVGLAGALTLVGVRAPRAAAPAPCAPDQSRIEVTVDGADLLAPAILEELEAELARAHLCASAPGDRSKPLARIRVTLRGDTSASIRIEDAVTKKTVEREVDVADFPADGRALPIAIAADELLRASWAEVSLRPEVENAREPVPPVVRASVAPPKRPPPVARRTELGLRATVNVYGGGQTHLGGALYARRDLGAWVTGEAFAYAREAMPVTATNGSITTHAWGGGLSLDLHLLRAGGARFGVKAGAELGYVLFEGSARAGARAATFGSVVAFGKLGVIGAFDVGPVRVSAAILGLAPFRSADALDGVEVATSVGGPGAEAALGAGVTF